MNPIAVAEIVIVSIYLMLPFVPGANPFNDAFDVEVRQLRADRHDRGPAHPRLWWEVSAKNWFTGPEAQHRRGRVA